MWAGISKNGATQIVMFSGIVTATLFVDILSTSLIPFIWAVYSGGHHLFQDNDPNISVATLDLEWNQLMENPSTEPGLEPH